MSSRVLDSFVYGIATDDLLTFVAAPLALVAGALFTPGWSRGSGRGRGAARESATLRRDSGLAGCQRGNPGVQARGRREWASEGRAAAGLARPPRLVETFSVRLRRPGRQRVTPTSDVRFDELTRREDHHAAAAT